MSKYLDYDGLTYFKEKCDDEYKVTANPTLDGTEEELTGVTIGGTNYKITLSATTETDDDGNVILVLGGGN